MGSAVLPRWRVLGASIRGSAHRRQGLPNQDSWGSWPEPGAGDRVIVALADGHGSAKCFRSGDGARLAVDVAVAVGRRFLEGQGAAPSLSATKRTAEEGLPHVIVRHWRERVEQNLRDSPLTAAELEDLERAEGPSARKSIESSPWLSYGATLLTVILTSSYAIYLQLGDGEIVAVDEDGTRSRPIPPDSRLLANETTSLCSDRAWDQFRFHFQVLSDGPPALVLLTTDGYSNSFQSEDGFLQAGPDYLELMRSEGLGFVEARLPTWLEEATQAGSGDDVTLGLVVRIEPPFEAVASRTSSETSQAPQPDLMIQRSACQTSEPAPEVVDTLPVHDEDGTSRPSS